MKLLSRIILALLICAGTVYTMTAPPAANFPNHNLARIIFWHLPCALTCSLFVIAAPYFAFRYLGSKQSHWDIRCVAAMEMTLTTGLLTLATGMIFAKVQWGDYWTWDPRQTSFLLVMLMVGAYFALRAGFSEPARRAANSGAYILAAVLPILFLFFVFPQLQFSLHPNGTIVKNQFDPIYRATFYSMFALILIVCIWLYKLRVRAGLLEEAVENLNARMANRDHSTPSGVVRPISLHQ